MDRRRIIEKADEFVRGVLERDSSGHDWWHIHRVRETSLWLEKMEGPADRFVIELAALLHDIDDWKITGSDLLDGPQQARKWMVSSGLDVEHVEAICRIISEVSFQGAAVRTPVSSIEGKIVQDADRLDALGAIGIARAFAYGGSTGQPIHDPSTEPVEHRSFSQYRQSRTTTVNHFHEKLFLLQDRFNTETARLIARQRTEYMKEFICRFHSEWTRNA